MALLQGVEYAKQDLCVRSFRVHSDEPIRAMLLVIMPTLMADSLLECQVRQAGLHVTTWRVIE